MLSCLMGTPFLPQLRHSILVLEDVDESPYRIDRLFAQMYNAGVLDTLAGLVLGKFSDCIPDNPKEPHLSIDQILEEYSAKIKCPVISNFQYGHIQRKLTIPIGLRATLDTKRNKIAVIESAVI